MARPQKDGIDYFPLCCQFSDSVKLIQAEFGLVGLGILIRLWQKIYGGKGYYAAWDSDVALVFASECGVGASVVHEVVSACLRRGIFDKSMYDRYEVLTSQGIQERYAEATERRSSQKIDFRYLLINAPKNWVSAYNNPINVDNKAQNEDDNPQSKVNKSKVNHNGRERASAHAPTRQEVDDYCREKGYPFSAKFYAHYQAKLWEGVRDFRAKADEWHLQDKEKSDAAGGGQSSFDVDDFFEAAIRNTYEGMREELT